MNEEHIVGVFLGLESSKNEYIAEIISPFQADYRPEIGSFMLIDNIGEYIIARVMDYVPKGELTTFMGEKWLADVALDPDAIGHDIKTRKVSYRVKIKLLGTFNPQKKEFRPGIRKIPHITSEVKSAGTETVRAICNQALKEQEKGPLIGKYSLDKDIDIHFNLNDLISKRSFIFARAGYGKSNLMKVLASNWRRGNSALVIFDQEGEYGFTDVKGRPGIMDRTPAIVVTNRREHRGKPNVYSNMRINLKELNPGLIIPILVPESKQDFIFFGKLMNLNQERWGQLVDLLHEDGWGADGEAMRDIVEGTGSTTSLQDMQFIRNNLVVPISRLHDEESRLISLIDQAVRDERILIIDISLLGSKDGLRLASLIVKNMLNNNKRYFTSEDAGRLRKAVFVIEEAQNVLGESDIGTFVELVKEGRKYQLGGIFITQQPGSIPPQILSQADNFFVFHLLGRNDLKHLQSANAHYSNDVITQILSEPIKGKAYLWTSHQPFVIPVKITFFENETKPDKAEELQRDNPILQESLDQLLEGEKMYRRILGKYREVCESEPDPKKRNVQVYRNLKDDELDWCRERGHLAVHNEEEFAIKYDFARKLDQDRG